LETKKTSHNGLIVSWKEYYMMNTVVRAFIIFLLVFPILNVEHVVAQILPEKSTPKITTRFYAAFLNSRAEASLPELYDQSMESASPSIFRMESPGNYSYRVSEEEEDQPLFLLSINTALLFYQWLEINKFRENQGYCVDATEPIETDLSEILKDQFYSDSTTKTHFLPPREGEAQNSFSHASWDPQLICCLRNFSIESTPAPKLEETSTIVPMKTSPKEGLTPDGSPIERKFFKGISAYVITIAGLLLGVAGAGIVALYVGATCLPTLYLVAAGMVIGLIAGIYITDIVWSYINKWLGPP